MDDGRDMKVRQTSMIGRYGNFLLNKHIELYIQLQVLDGVSRQFPTSAKIRHL
jgi:hypothetical protein